MVEREGGMVVVSQGAVGELANNNDKLFDGRARSRRPSHGDAGRKHQAHLPDVMLGQTRAFLARIETLNRHCPATTGRPESRSM